LGHSGTTTTAYPLLHKKDRARILNKRFCCEENVEVPWSDIVKGYEYARLDGRRCLDGASTIPTAWRASCSCCLMLDKEIERAGARVEYVSGSFEDTPAGRMFYQFKGVIAEYERGVIRERTKRGKLEKARRGLVSYYPYGYRPLLEAGKSTGRMAIHDEEASTVRMIFEWFVTEQRSIRSIVVELRRLGLRPQKGGPWAKSMVRRILTNRAYIGVAAYALEAKSSERTVMNAIC